MNKYIAHFKTITKHRNLVMLLCFRCHFYKRGLLHDLSKYSKTEFCSSAKYFQGNSSPIDAEKNAIGYSLAWQHHKGHNPHHWEYWIDNLGTKENTPIKMPFEYVVEMICDWISASIVYSKRTVNYDEPYPEPQDYYEAHKDTRIFHPKTEKLITYFLEIITEYGINTFIDYVKHQRKVLQFSNDKLR